MDSSTDVNVFYFAYGADMNPERLNIRQIPFLSRYLGRLQGFELAFNKLRDNGTAGANIRKKCDKSVYGAVYTLGIDALSRLDMFEGVGKNVASRQMVKVSLGCGKCIEAHIYVASELACNDQLNSISKDYLDNFLCNEDFLPKEYCEFLRSFEQWSVVSCPTEDYYLLDGANETEE